MTTPNLVPSNYDTSYRAFLKTKVDRAGVMTLQSSSVSVTSGSVVGTIAGLIPIQKGARIDVGATKIVSAALGASVTASVGIIYDDNVGNTNVATLFASGLTAVAAGGELVLTPSVTNLPYVATGNGWLAITTAGATTSSTGSIFAQVALVYDGLDAAN